MTQLVSFEVAKLLKEKSFDELCDKKYIARCLWQSDNSRQQYKNSEIHQNSSDTTAPTISEAVMWLYNKYRIWIEVYYDIPKKKFYIVWNGEEYNFNSPSEAYEAAIKYVLKNLI